MLVVLVTPDEGPSLETSIFPLSFQVVREPLPFLIYILNFSFGFISLDKVYFENNFVNQLTK